MELIDKSAVENILRELWIEDRNVNPEHRVCYNKALREVQDKLDTLEVKEVELTNEKIKWSPSKKQMESLKDMLKYNIGVFDYQKFMEVNSLYDDLTKILDYGTDIQK